MTSPSRSSSSVSSAGSDVFLVAATRAAGAPARLYHGAASRPNPTGSSPPADRAHRGIVLVADLSHPSSRRSISSNSRRPRQRRNRMTFDYKRHCPRPQVEFWRSAVELRRLRSGRNEKPMVKRLLRPFSSRTSHDLIRVDLSTLFMEFAAAGQWIVVGRYQCPCSVPLSWGRGLG